MKTQLIQFSLIPEINLNLDYPIFSFTDEKIVKYLLMQFSSVPEQKLVDMYVSTGVILTETEPINCYFKIVVHIEFRIAICVEF